jgi:hypothetical protein
MNDKPVLVHGSVEPIRSEKTHRSIYDIRQSAVRTFSKEAQRLTDLGAPPAAVLARAIELFAVDTFDDHIFNAEVIQEIKNIRWGNGANLDDWATVKPFLPPAA